MAVGSAYWREAEKAHLQECPRGGGDVIGPPQRIMSGQLDDPPVPRRDLFSPWLKIEKDGSSPFCNLGTALLRFPFSAAPCMSSVHASLR